MTAAEDLRAAAHGAIIGALAGDAAGATLEFLGRTPAEAEVEEAMQMVGGGVWSTAPGQITDDGELALGLARALASAPTFDIERVARHYRDWMASRPFDVGGTIATSFRAAQGLEFGIGKAMTLEAAVYSTRSKANGSLMRISPLGVWAGSPVILRVITDRNHRQNAIDITHLVEDRRDRPRVVVIAIPVPRDRHDDDRDVVVPRIGRSILDIDQI